MDELDLIVGEKSNVLRQSIGEKKKTEDEQSTKDRMRQTLKDRDAALQTIYDYQDRTGIPTELETEKSFFETEIHQKD
ncbi:MAG: hypothetical protein PHF86_04110 [Candidatus Nanoarchaeia archaeon]|jgi:hypothetical protein|nr:hypothetical protein [Candidatus Nanoarchaeia archaeon]